MSAFHANDLHREFVSSFHGIRWGLVQIAGRIFIALLNDDYPLVCLLALQFPTSEKSMPTEKLKMPTSEESMPTEELMPTQALKKRTKLARL